MGPEVGFAANRWEVWHQPLHTMPASKRTKELKEQERLAAMRMISAWVARHRDVEERMSTWDGCVGVGSKEFDHLLKATVGEAYLRVLKEGGSPQEAQREATIDGNQCVKVWGERTSKAVVDSLHASFLKMITKQERCPS